MPQIPMVAPIDEILADVRAGTMVALVDDRDGGEGVLCLAGERVTPEAINFMATHARGLISVALTEGRMRRLGIPLLGNPLAANRQPAFGASIEARKGVTTGISAADRACTIRVAVEGSFLGPYRLEIADDKTHLLALSAAFAVFGTSAREAIAAAAAMDDPVTADIFTEISRGVDFELWLLESHSPPGTHGVAPAALAVVRP